MGLTYVTVTLKASQTSKRKYETEFLVDTVATDIMAPSKELLKVGIKPV